LDLERTTPGCDRPRKRLVERSFLHTDNGFDMEASIIEHQQSAQRKREPMVASKNIERLEKSSVKLTVTVSKEDCKKEYDKLLAEYSRSVKIDGFRAGKVPTSVLERKFGEGLKIDAMGRVMEKGVEEAIKDIPERPIAYSQPSLEGEPDFSLDEDFTFTVKYDIFPVVEAPDWKGLAIEVPEAEVELEDEERELAALRERNAIVIEKEAGSSAEKGDVATMDYHEVDESGAALQASAREDFTFEIGTGYNLYKIDDEIVGMKVGDTKVIDKSYPADYEYSELAGRTLKVEVKLTKLKGKKLPELDDDFAQDVSEKFKTLADLRADLSAQLAKRLEARLRQLRERALIDALMNRATVDLPESMVEAELAMRLDNLMRQMGMDSMDKLDRMLAYSGKTRDALLAEWKPNAEKSIATRLVLEKLVEAGSYTVSDEEFESELSRIAAESNMSVDEVKAEYEKRGNLDYLKERIKEDKLLADMLAAAKVGKGKRLSFVDLLADNE
jgi:trigger factor